MATDDDVWLRDIAYTVRKIEEVARDLISEYIQVAKDEGIEPSLAGYCGLMAEALPDAPLAEVEQTIKYLVIGHTFARMVKDGQDAHR